MSEDSSPRIRLVRTVSFSAAHRYADQARSEAENRQVFGSLYRGKGFGHNFLLEAHVEGSVDPLNGMIMNLRDLDVCLQELAAALDHRHLNELPCFEGLAPTPERIARYCFDQLAPKISVASHGRSHLHSVRLYEGEDLWIDFAQRSL